MAAFTFITLTVNGRERQCDVDDDKPLLWVLREDLGLTGTKYGCGIARCGACTVLIGSKGNDLSTMKPVRSCVVRARRAENKSIVTIEGLRRDKALRGDDEHPVQKAWKAIEVPQCGYCQAGQIMTAVALLEAFPRDGRKLLNDDIDAALGGNLCRCGTYPRIRKGVQAAATDMGIEVEHETMAD
jgi:isoquinoline 1-oxidoreductase subunit alpha